MFSYHTVNKLLNSSAFNIIDTYKSYHIKLAATSFTYENNLILLRTAIYTTPASGIVTISTG